MRNWIANLRPALIASLALAVAWDLLGGEPPARPGPHVALIDMAKVLREYPQLRHALDRLERERGKHEARVDQQRRELAAQLAELYELDAASPQQALRQQQLEAARSELERSDERQLADFARRSARLHYLAFGEVMETVNRYATRNGVDLVLNYDSSEIDADDPEDVMRRIQDRVVYHANLNITEMIIQRLLFRNTFLAEPRPVKRYSPGTKVVYTPCGRPPRVQRGNYVLPRKAANTAVSITNRIQPHARATVLAYTCVPVGHFRIGDSSYSFLQEGKLADGAFQCVSDRVLTRLVEIQRENGWQMNDRVFKLWIKELEAASAGGTQE